jgi:hypothetical protein
MQTNGCSKKGDRTSTFRKFGIPGAEPPLIQWPRGEELHFHIPRERGLPPAEQQLEVSFQN